MLLAGTVFTPRTVDSSVPVGTKQRFGEVSSAG